MAFTELTASSLNTMTYMILRLAKYASPATSNDLIPYDELIHFACLLDEATEQEKQFVKQIIQEELESSNYLTHYDPIFTSFEDALSFFFSDLEDHDLHSFWFGKTVLEMIQEIQKNKLP